MIHGRVISTKLLATAIALLLSSGTARAWQFDEQTPETRRGPIWGVGETVGDGIGFDRSFTTTEALIPLYRDDGSLLFSDLRMMLVNLNTVAANLGGGYRFYSEQLDRTIGFHVHYDYRDTHGSSFKQITSGVEILGDQWDFRTNAYLPSAFGDQFVRADRFDGHFLLLNRFALPMHGFDTELGTRLPVLERFQPKLFGGCYHFAGTDVPDVWGWKVRLESRVTDTLALDLAVQDDATFGTTVNARISFRFPTSGFRNLESWRDLGRRVSRRVRYRSPVERLDDRVERLNYVVVGEQQGTIARHPAIDPLSGQPHPKADQPIVFLHVAPGGNSDGSFADPYATLNAALADPRYQNGQVDVVYARHNASAPIVHSGDITNLVPGTRILGNGPFQSVNTQLGFQHLPFSGVDPLLLDLPRITGSVSLADDTTLSGFDVQRGVFGDGVSGINLVGNRIRNVGGDAVRLTRIGGRLAQPFDADDIDQFNGVRIENNRISASGGRGVSVEVTALTDNVLIGKNVIESNGGSGIHIGGSDYGVIGTIGPEAFNTRVEVGLTQVKTTGGHGVEIDGTDFRSNSRVFLSDSRVESSGGNGVHIAGDNFAGAVFIQRTQENAANDGVGIVNSSDGFGIALTAPNFRGALQVIGNSRISGTSGIVINGVNMTGLVGIASSTTSGGQPVIFPTQEIVATNGNGIEVSSANPLGLGIQDLRITSTGGNGVVLRNVNSVDLSGGLRQIVSGNEIIAPDGSGLLLQQNPSDFYNMAIFDNTIRNSADNGMRLDIGETEYSLIQGNNVIGSGAEGVLLRHSGGTFPGNQILFRSNTLSSNNGGGSDLLADFTGTGELLFLLEGNSSSNSVPTGQFNYDMRSSGGGSLRLLPESAPGVFDQTNTGSVGLNGILLAP
ncbi:MAG: inverse autotransporter beta domain-containing protein [Planctomycetota bacterium]|nr:inverse autotransporter beta domain-containing protein [Planctomycetota bacterium]